MKTIHLFQYEAEPEFTDGRTSRLKAMANYLAEAGHQVVVHSLGRENSVHECKSVKHIKMKFFALSLANNKKTCGKPKKSFQLIAVIANRIFFPDRYLIALPLVYKTLKNRVNEGDILLLTVPWFSAILIIFFPFLKKRKIKVIIDYRDLWTNNPIFSGGKVNRNISEIIESKALKKAYLITSTTTKSKDFFTQKTTTKNIQINNGITLEEYKKIQELISENTKHSSVDLIYLGNIGNKRECKSLIQAINNKNISFDVYGNLDSTHMNICKRNYKGSVKKETAIEHASKSRSILIVIRKAENSDFAIPGKIYEAVALKKAILLYCPIDALVLDYLRDIDFPYFHINSESKECNLEEKLEKFKEFIKSINNNDFYKDFSIPIREEELAKILPYIE